MALIKCPECGKEISDKAMVCIHCGCPIMNVEQDEADTATKKKKQYRVQHNNDYSDSKKERRTVKDFLCGKAFRIFLIVVFVFVLLRFWPLMLLLVVPATLFGIKLWAYSTLVPHKGSQAWDKEELYGYKLTCPRCRSKNFKKIGKTKVGGFAVIGHTLGENGDRYECEDCKYRW